MKQKSENQRFLPTIGFPGNLVIPIALISLVGIMFSIPVSGILWPLRIVVPGLALFLAAQFLDEEIGAALSIAGATTAMSGTILLGQSLTDLWASWAYVWTLLFPTAVGLGMLAYGGVDGNPALRRAGWHLTGIGLALFLVFTTFFEFIIGISGFDLRFGWPLLIVALGLLLLALWRFDFKQVDVRFSTEADTVPGRKK